MRFIYASLIAVAGVCAANVASDACTTFCVKAGDAILFGRNYDFDFGRGLLILNPAGLRKTGYETGGPTWMARHGSVTFNQFGREFPMGGMNDAGLVVELMWHERAQYPAADARAPLGNLQWIQYQLDTAASVEDVIASDAHVRIVPGVPLHFLVSDRSGRVATIEFIAGALKARTGDTLPVGVLANDSYDDSLAFWQQQRGRRAPGSASHARFARAADGVREIAANGTNAVDRAFAILADVAQRSTRWSIVYDQTQGIVRFRTDTNSAIRSLRLTSADFDCARGARLLDVNAPGSGDVSARLEQYSDAANRALVEASYRDFSGTRGTPPEELARIASYPSAATCGS